jgi:hypothetical protein
MDVVHHVYVNIVQKTQKFMENNIAITVYVKHVELIIGNTKKINFVKTAFVKNV